MDTGRYQPLFIVGVEHGYFADGRWQGLDFVPDAETSRMAELPCLVLRQTDSGVMVGVDEARREPLRIWAAAGDGRLRFRFKVRARDRTYANYTDDPRHGRNAVPCFDNQGHDGQAGEVAGLSQQVQVSEADCREIEALVTEGTLDAREARVPPDFIVTIYIDPTGDQGFALRQYRIAFAARQSFWKYYLLGDMNRAQSFIVDLEKRIEFLPGDEAVVAGNRPARVFRSKQTVPLLERPEYRFQLRERGTVGERVLIKRLPLASGSRLGSELIDGRRELVMENFVQY